MSFPKSMLLTSAAVAALCLVHTSAAEAKQRLRVDYMKSSPDSVSWNGMGQANGAPVQITANWPLTGRRVTGRVTHVTEFFFCVKDAINPNIYVVISLKGIINQTNALIVFNGEVTASTNAAIPKGTKAQLRAKVVSLTPFTTMGSVYMTIP